MFIFFIGNTDLNFREKHEEFLLVQSFLAFAGKIKRGGF